MTITTNVPHTYTLYFYIYRLLYPINHPSPSIHAPSVQRRNNSVFWFANLRVSCCVFRILRLFWNRQGVLRMQYDLSNGCDSELQPSSSVLSGVESLISLFCSAPANQMTSELFTASSTESISTRFPSFSAAYWRGDDSDFAALLRPLQPIAGGGCAPAYFGNVWSTVFWTDLASVIETIESAPPRYAFPNQHTVPYRTPGFTSARLLF